MLQRNSSTQTAIQEHAEARRKRGTMNLKQGDRPGRQQLVKVQQVAQAEMEKIEEKP